ncbi:MAG TPA: hypothetical protein VGP07_12775 [Polyangia bacterium]|jgi:hypothetical protein
MRGAHRKSWWFAALVLLVTLAPGPVWAGPTVVSTTPFPDLETGDLTFFVGGINENGRSLKASRIELVIDGERTAVPPVTQSLSDWATVSAEASQTWRPPLTVGLVYLWVQGVPTGVLDGIQGFFRQVPSRTPLYPTIYGRMRQDRARLTASEVSRLAEEVPYLEGYRPNLIEAVRLDLQELTTDSAALKVLLVVTDGRDFADPKGDGPGDFAALGREIHKAGVTLLIVSWAPEADAGQASANLRDLQEASGGFLRVLDQKQDLDNALESLGQAVADLQRVHFTPPWTWRTLGGTHRLSIRLTTPDGQQLTRNVGEVGMGAQRPWWMVAVAVVILALLILIVLLVVRRRPRAEAAEEEEEPAFDDEGVDEGLLTTAHDLIRRGASPKRAAEELIRSHPESVRSLVELGPSVFADPRFPYFRTRLGKLRLQEIIAILAKKSEDGSVLGERLANVLAEAIGGHVPPDKAAEAITGRVAADEWTAFAGLDFEELAEALGGAARAHSVLGLPRARGIAVEIQDALRAGSGARGIVVGWLVRTGGPGTRGETLRLTDGATLIGQAPECAVRILGDPAVAAEHAEVSLARGEFTIVGREGPVTVEGKRIGDRHTLADGETIGIGGGLFVFKSASAGNLSRLSTAPPSRGASPRGR